MHDLEIRGAGTLLGDAQSGHIAAVGFDMYLQILEQAVQELKGEEVEEEVEPEIDLPIPAFIPADYVEDINQRLVFYRRLSSARSGGRGGRNRGGAAGPVWAHSPGCRKPGSGHEPAAPFKKGRSQA